MSIRLVWPTRWCKLTPRGYGALNATRLIKEGRLHHVVLVLGGLVVLVTITLLLATQDVGVHILCTCEGATDSGQREARYLAAIMAETDHSTGRSARELLQEEHPSLAVQFLLAQELKGQRCPLVPGLFSIRHHNTLWQEASLGRYTLLLYSAYYDDRDAVDFLHWQYPAEGAWQPYLISCRAGTVKPRAVSVVRYACQVATNVLLVRHSHAGAAHSAGRRRQQQASSAGDGRSGKQEEKATGSDAYEGPSMDGGEWNKQEYNSEADVRQTAKLDLALCHKFLFNPIRDDSSRLIEWLEAARSWGVDHVTLYLHSAPPAMRAVLDLYRGQGFITVVPWTNPGHHPNAPALQRAFYDTQRYALFTLENIPYTDCLLRSMTSFRYVALWDMDEFLLPAPPFTSLAQMVDHAKARWYQGHAGTCDKHFSGTGHFEVPSGSGALIDGVRLNGKGQARKLAQLIDRRQNQMLPSGCRLPSSYLGRCTYFFDSLAEAGDGPHMLHHVTRTAKFAPPLVHTKAIHDTTRALGLHAHFALYTLEGWVDRQHDLYQLYPASEGYLAHYRSTCQGENQTECETQFRPFLVRDERMWQHRDSILEGVTRTLRALGLPNLG